MARHYPALDIRFQTPPGADRIERLLAVLDDDEPTAVEERASGLAVFFATAERRDRALETARSFAPESCVTSLSVSDEAWAERSQASLTAIRVGGIVVTPPWARATTPISDDDIIITIVPSMGFGTGHHASTRLCLRLLQPWRPGARSVLDVGTGSGVLAIAAWRLGAAHVVGIDVDPDALASARENVALNGGVGAIEIRLLDLALDTPQLTDRFELGLANLTGAMLERFAPQLAVLVASDGSLIISGFQVEEEAGVTAAFGANGFTVTQRAEEDHWIAIALSSRVEASDAVSRPSSP
jgi:ribosomal protein L11 methyltransferase